MAAETLIVEDAYQRGYADAIADMRKKKEQRRQREQAKKARRWYFIKQKAYATTFNAPYLLYEFEDGTKIYERIDAHALDSADMSDVIMQYDHEGRVFARQSNNTLILEPDVKGLFVAADLSRTDLARGLYQDISAGMITKMSWAFTVAEESYDRETHTRTILKIKKVYDVSAVSIPANNDTEISARAFASRSYERERQELLKRRAAILKIKASL